MLNINLRPSQLAVGNRQIHYAWVIVGVAALMRLSSSSFRTSSSILIPRLVETFGWSYGIVGGAFALQWVVSGMFGAPSGWLGDRYGVRVAMTVGAILYVVGMVLTATVNHWLLFYLYFGVIVSASMGIFQVPLTAGVTPAFCGFSSGWAWEWGCSRHLRG